MKKRNDMRKVWTLVLSAMLCVLLLTACGSDKYADSKYLGTWHGTSADFAGISMPVEEVLDGEFTFELRADGTCTATVAGEKENGKWEETEDGFKVEDEFEFKVKDGKALLNYSDVNMHFERQK